MLEQARNLTGVCFNIHAAECRIGTGTRHQADGAGAGAEELGAGIDQNVADGQCPAFRNTLERWIVGKTQVSLDHHCCEVGVLGIIFEHLGLGFCFPDHEYAPEYIKAPAYVPPVEEEDDLTLPIDKIQDENS